VHKQTAIEDGAEHAHPRDPLARKALGGGGKDLVPASLRNRRRLWSAP